MHTVNYFSSKMYLSLSLCVAMLHFVVDEARLINGKNVTIYAFPYQAAIYRYTARFKGFSGGAIIVSAKYLLTAAHCVGGNPKEYYVVIGYSQIPNNFENIFLFMNNYKLEDIKIHPDYDISRFPTNADHDIALLTIAGELKLNGVTSKPIGLSLEPTPPGTMAELSGYGISEVVPSGQQNIKVNNFYRHLRAAPVPIIAHESCVKYFSGFDTFYHVTENMICAGRFFSNGSCEGDSGGALVKDNKLIGIVSYGWGCGNYDPGVYTSIHGHQKFIMESFNYTLGV